MQTEVMAHLSKYCWHVRWIIDYLKSKMNAETTNETQSSEQTTMAEVSINDGECFIFMYKKTVANQS